MKNNNPRFIRLRAYNNNYHAAYIELVDHPHKLENCVSRTVRVDSTIDNYNGPVIKLNFNKDNIAIGIEILYSYDDDDDDDDDDDPVVNESEVNLD